MSHPRTNNGHLQNSNRNTLSLSDTDERRRDGLLRLAFIQIVAGFPCRPSPRSIWDETATGDQTPWKYVIAPLRNAVFMSVRTGDKQLVESTLEGIRGFLREVEADVCSLVPPVSEDPCAVTLALEETELEGHANPVQMAFVANPSPIEAEKAVVPLTRQYERLGNLIRGLRKHARAPRNTSMAVVR